MAKKKHKADDRKHKQQPRRPADLPDPQVMEGVMRQFVADDTPLGKAQALVYQAFKEPDEGRRVELARDALALCPDCADAYRLLAEHAPSRKQALELYRQ